MQIEERFITSNNQGDINTCTPKYIVIHDTGNTGKGAGSLNHYKWLNNNNDLGRSAHIFVDEQTAIQVIPFNRMSHHAGILYKDKVDVPECKNHNSIGIEFCINQGADLDKTLLNLAEVVMQLQQQFNIPIQNVITHYMSTGKSCPGTFIRKPILWTQLKERLISMNTQNQSFHKAIEIIHQQGIIQSPEYWHKQTNINVQNLIINMSNYLNREEG